jgi:hypothetical protein
MQILGASKFDQCALNMSLINICNQNSYVGQEMLKIYNAWKDETGEAINNPWLELQQFTIYVPHPDQEYEDMTLEAGLTKGYNIEVKPVQDRSQVPYKIPEGGHFVVIMKQKGLNADFAIAATGVFIRPLGILSLDIIVDQQKNEYQSVVVLHPVIRDYPSGWQEKVKMFFSGNIRGNDLPNLVGHVDQAFNRDYRPPSWNEVYLSASGFKGF